MIKCDQKRTMYFLEEGSCTLTSAHPMKGILVPLAAIKSRPTLGNSDMFLTGVPRSLSSNIPLVVIDTWAPVFQKSSYFDIIQQTLNSTLFSFWQLFHRFPYLHMIRPLLLLTTWGAEHTTWHCEQRWNTTWVSTLTQQLYRWEAWGVSTTSGPA